MDYNTTLEMDRATLIERSFINTTYGWMSAGLALTGLVSTYIASSQTALAFLLANSWIIWVCFIAEFVIALTISNKHISGNASMIIFLLFSTLMGLSLAPIFLIYTKATIAKAFFSTAGMFGAMAIYGHTTKKDLTSVGSYAIMALWGIIIASIVNIFLRSPAADFIISIIGVVVFLALTAFDAQKIKQIAYSNMEATESQILKLAILAALALYLDFINLFLFLLRIFGRRD